VALTNPRVRQSYRLNVGTIVEEAMLKVRLVRARGGGSGSTGALGRGGRMLENRGIFHRGLVVATPSLAARWCVTKRLRGPGLRLPAPTTRTQKCRPTWAASFRSRLIWRTGSKAPGRQARLECAAGIRCATGSRCRRIFARPRRAGAIGRNLSAGNKQYLVCYPFEAGWRIRRSHVADAADGARAGAAARLCR